MFKRLSIFLCTPELYAPSSAPFWDDEHNSKNMLSAMPLSSTKTLQVKNSPIAVRSSAV